MSIGVLDKDGNPQTIATIDDLIAIFGQGATPAANTLQARIEQLKGFTDGVEALITSTNAALATLIGATDQLEGYTDGLETLAGTTNTSLAALVSGLGSPGPQTFNGSTSITPQITSDSTKARITAAASTNSNLVNAAARVLRSIDVYNEAAYSVYLKLYDKATAPTVGTDTPFWTIPIAAGSGFSRTFLFGLPVTLGLGYAITKNKADADTTVVAAGDLVGMITWR